MQNTKNIYSVSQVNRYIKKMFDEDFILNNICIKGEISNCKYHYSGHIYFSLKDETGVISGVMFASDAASLRFRLSDGMQVNVTCRISVYEKGGNYQFYAKKIEQDGFGDLFRRFEELKERLRESGMFDDMYKKPVPAFSYRIGVVTAETGAVIRDIYNVASRRNPYCSIVLYPAKVQGEGAARTICAGIRTLDRMGLDVIIVGRGGGSIEDLWAFNEEIVAREIFNAVTPVISAVGHETDYTIADFAADLRAPTPSAAAELAVFDYRRFLEDLEGYGFKLKTSFSNILKQYSDRLDNYRLTLDINSPLNQIQQKSGRLLELNAGLNELMNLKMSISREKLIAYSERLEGLSPLKRLSEGYAFVTDAGGKCIRSIRQADAGDMINVELRDGTLSAEIMTVVNTER
ncbi:MAG: exodeoxyribonuclease VII large subunit [Parasporobacterium sp.]|nr:exodeoxyribonuclease VII large subunit [Parasporobacterium sp.]